MKLFYQFNEDRERKQLERAIRKNGNVSMLDHCEQGSWRMPPLDVLGQKLREVYDSVSPQELPNTFESLFCEFEMKAA